RKDSLHITDADRELVRATIAAQPARHVLVTHGTDSMVQTGMVLRSIADKTIVMTGALSPARFRGSDAEFNIGCAIGAVQTLPAAVSIAMNGLIWDPARVRKNVAANRFEPACAQGPGEGDPCHPRTGCRRRRLSPAALPR